MKQNVGTADRAIRVAAGLALLSLILILEGNARWLGLAGLVPLLTGFVGRCPLYVPLGINTKSAACHSV